MLTLDAITTATEPMIILIILIFTLVMLILGHLWKIGVFNLVAVGGLFYLMWQFKEDVILVVVFIGLIMFEMYATFFKGGSKDL